MPARKRIAVAVSGGIDSLSALLLLKDAGHDVFALRGRFLASEEPKTTEFLASICARYGIELRQVDLSDAFAASVSQPFIAACAGGLTPNPCALCNRRIKFGALLQTALALGADSLATGHYARLRPNPYGSGQILVPAKDKSKDQNYFLALVRPEDLARVTFPLADRLKRDCRQFLAAIHHDSQLPPESQDICFLGGEAAPKFLARHLRPERGPVLLCENKDDKPSRMRCLGWHDGLWQYTIGQRQGLGIPFPEPLFVVGKSGNALIVGRRQRARMSACRAGSLVLHVSPKLWPANIFVRLRHNQPLGAAVVVYTGGSLDIRLAEPRFPTAPGQIAAIYDACGQLLAGGIVEEIELA